MTENQTKRIVPPNPARMISGMRDTGYSITTAIADLIDNSISANASVVEVNIEELFGDQLRVTVIDNGHGMDMEGLINAMTYGSPPRQDLKSLGKFGLGLKTASSAFSTRFSAISRMSASDPVARATWDLERVRETGTWEMETVLASKMQIELLETVAKDHGTLILWESVDRLLSIEDMQTEKRRKNALLRIERDITRHLGQVFQRFIKPRTNKTNPIEIFINGNKVGAWDPFCEDEEHTYKVLSHNQAVELSDGSKVEFSVRSFVLPRPEQFSSPDAAKNAAINNENQGVYVYREDRLIHGPDWMGSSKKEPHYSYARIDLSFDHRLDDAFNVDIKKSRILLNESLLLFLEEKVFPSVRNYANQRYREGKNKQAHTTAAGIHDSANAIMGQYEDEVSDNKIIDKDPVLGIATIQNANGTAPIRLLKPEEAREDQPYIVSMESLLEGILWEPMINNDSRAVALNTSHPFYQKVYLPLKQTDIVIQSFDYLIWAMAIGEMNTINEKVKVFYEDLRRSVSRSLRTLSERLPDIELEDE
jgi:hypothetical protein